MAFTHVFIHGLESSSRGNKGVFFRARYPDMLIEDFKGTLEQRMEKLNRILSDKKDLILVGSSFGGLMAAIYACNHGDRVKKLILLAPALDLDDFKPFAGKRMNLPVTIFHGRDDDVVPPAPVRQIASQVFANLSYHLVDDDHPLRETFTTYDWDALLRADA
jgi:pimeloyl-ACP methyl ester carboxylesterase